MTRHSGKKDEAVIADELKIKKKPVKAGELDMLKGLIRFLQAHKV